MKPNDKSQLSPDEVALLDAAQNGGVRQVERLLASGVNANVRDDRWAPWDVTPLMRAARDRHTPVVRALLAAGANVKARDKHFPQEPAGRTALHYAAGKRHVEIARLLIEAGAAPNAVGICGAGTPLQAAIDGDPEGEPSQPFVSFSEMIKEAQAGPSEAECKAAFEFVRFLLSAGADPNRADRLRGDTVLHSAAGRGMLDVVQALLDSGADVNHQDKCGWTAFTAAATHEIAMVLLERGLDVTLKDESGWTALHWAAQRNNPKLIDALLQKGAKLNQQDDEGQTALDIAIRDDCRKAAQFLRTKGAGNAA